MKKIGWILLGAAVILVGMQFLPVSKTNPPITGEIQVAADVRQVLRRACYDCHSNETRWPWYSHVAPISWLLINHVEEGREHLNFSEWNKYDAAKQAKLLKKSWQEVKEGEMPINTYVWQHPAAKLTEADQALIRRWVTAALPPGTPLESAPEKGDKDDD